MAFLFLAGQFDISLEGRLTNSQTQKLNIGPLTKDDYVSDYIAVIDQGVSAREDIPVALKFNGERSYPRSYKIRQLAEIVRYLPSLDAINGKGHDPLKLIDGRLRTQVDLKMGDTKLFSFTESVGVPSPKEELVSYWDALLNGEGFIPSNVRRQKRGDDVYNLILRRNIDEIAEWKTGDRDFGGNWKDNPDVTIAGLLKNKRWRYPVIDKKGKIVSGSSSNPNYRALVEAYHSIGTVMLRDRKEFGGFFGISAAKNNYSAIVNQLARGADGRF